MSNENSQKFKIGCHLSASKGFLNMGKEIVALGGNTFQFFTRNPRGGAAKDIDEKDVEAFKKFADENGIEVILAHAPYTLNACSADESIRDFAKRTFADDLARMEYVPGNLYNFHPGSHVKQGVETGTEYIVEMLNETIKESQTTTVLLETMAGKGSEVGRTFEELRKIYDRVERKDRLRVCFDTCHVNDAGYDLVNDYEGVLAQFDKILGLNQIAVIHVNDSLNPLGAHKDRHANIGQGTIGYETLHRIVHDERFTAVPKILETPWLCAEGEDKKTIPPYKQEIAWLKASKQMDKRTDD